MEKGWGLTKDTGQLPVHHLIEYPSFFRSKQNDIQQLGVNF